MRGLVAGYRPEDAANEGHGVLIEYCVGAVEDDEQVVANGGIVHLEHALSGPQRQVGPMLQMSESPLAAQGASPPLGRDTDAILAEAGYNADEVAELRDAGTIA